MTDGARVESLITTLVQDAPARDPDIVAGLVAALQRIAAGGGAAAALALAIARIVELVDEDLVDPGIALPALASACATLAGGLAGRYTATTLEAARYEIDTLEPLPDRPAPPAPTLVTIRGRPPRT